MILVFDRDKSPHIMMKSFLSAYYYLILIALTNLVYIFWRQASPVGVTTLIALFDFIIGQNETLYILSC